jgi:hypothetical protein
MQSGHCQEVFDACFLLVLLTRTYVYHDAQFRGRKEYLLFHNCLIPSDLVKCCRVTQKLRNRPTTDLSLRSLQPNRAPEESH